LVLRYGNFKAPILYSYKPLDYILRITGWRNEKEAARCCEPLQPAVICVRKIFNKILFHNLCRKMDFDTGLRTIPNHVVIFIIA
jgi:hypothetical protein